MASGTTLICPTCGKAYGATQEYLAENAGLEMECKCGQAIAISLAATEESTDSEHTAVAAPSGVWSDGCFVVVSRGTRLPKRCIVCNQAIDGDISPRTLKWTPRNEGNALQRRQLGPAGALLGNAIAASYTQQIVVRAGMCPQHQSELRKKQIWTLLLILGAVGGVVACFNLPTQSIQIVVAVFSGIIAVAAFVLWARLHEVRVDHFEGNYAWLEGFGDAFIESLPAYQEMVETSREDAARSLEEM